MSVNIVNPDGSLTQVSGGISQEILDAKANQSEIGTVETTNTATSAHPIDSYFINASGQFVRATSAIAVGDTIIIKPTSGYNCEGTDIASILTELNSDKISKSQTAGLVKNDGTIDTNTYATVSKVNDITSQVRRDITSDLANLPTAVSEQNLEKYGYKIGDYFQRTVGTRTYTYHLADMNTFYGGYSAYAVVATPHVGIVVDTGTNSQWYTGSNITGVSYENSTLHIYLKGDVLNNIKADMIALFGGSTGLEHLLSHTKLYNTLGAWAWGANPDYISALTEVQMYGCKIWSADNYQQGEGDKQLELFAKYKYNLIYGSNHIWLRSITSSADACCAIYGGVAASYDVTYSHRASGLILFH